MSFLSHQSRASPTIDGDVTVSVEDPLGAHPAAHPRRMRRGGAVVFTMVVTGRPVTDGGL
jgi:hypothetical protein